MLARPILPSFANANEMERQMDQWDLVIKVKHGDTLRRMGAYVHGQLRDLNMSKLRYKIISLFKISHDAELILTYTDEDGDIVTLDDDEELRDAVIGQRLNPLRINVQLKSTDSSDARPERSTPSSSVNAPWPVVRPVVEQENAIPEPLSGVVSNVVGIAQQTLSASPVFAKEVDVMKSEPLGSAMGSLSKDVKKDPPFSPALAQVVEHLSDLGLSSAGQTLGHSGESSGVPRGASTQQMGLHVSEEPKCWTGPILEAKTTNMEGSAGIMDGGSRSKQPSMKADLSSPSQTGFSSQVNVPIIGPLTDDDYLRAFTDDDYLRAITDAGYLRMFSRMSEGTKTPPRRRHLIIDDSMPKSFHRGVQCDRCGMHPIVGPRFKSNMKEDYDLCDTCFTQMGKEAGYTRIEHTHHPGPMNLKHARMCCPPSNVLHACGVMPQRTRPSYI